MNYCIMNNDKYGRGAVYGLQIEANRQPGDGREFDRSDIDPERTKDNIFLRRTENWNRHITAEIKTAGVKERKNSVVMITGVYTASPEYFEAARERDRAAEEAYQRELEEYEAAKAEWDAKPPWARKGRGLEELEPKPPEPPKSEILRYFEDCLDFHDRTYGRAFNAVVHMDETTPHMQVASVPIIEDEKGAHLSAKIIMGNRKDYRIRQDRFHEEVGMRYGLDRGERLEPAETKRHTLKREWQLATQEEELKRQEEELERLKGGRDAVAAEVEELEQAKEEIVDTTIEARRQQDIAVQAAAEAEEEAEKAKARRAKVEGELRREEKRLSIYQKTENGGEPYELERLKEVKDNRKYSLKGDRVTLPAEDYKYLYERTYHDIKADYTRDGIQGVRTDQLKQEAIKAAKRELSAVKAETGELRSLAKENAELRNELSAVKVERDQLKSFVKGQGLWEAFTELVAEMAERVRHTMKIDR